MTSRYRTIAAAVLAAIALGALALALPACKTKKVDVQTGTQVLCTYGEVVSEDVETLSVPEKDAGKYSVETSVVTCPLHKKVEELYAAAQADIAKGDLKSARSKLSEVLASDPKYRDAQSQADDIDRGRTPSPSPTGGGGGTPGSKPATTQPAGPVLGLLDYVPDKIAGYSAQAIAADVLSVSRVYIPQSGGDVLQLVIAADQYKDAAQAKSKAAEVKSAYPTSPAAVKVGGRDAYFGVNSRGYAVIGLADGSSVVVFEMYSKSGKPANLKSTLAQAADLVL